MTRPSGLGTTGWPIEFAGSQKTRCDIRAPLGIFPAHTTVSPTASDWALRDLGRSI
jgi:hypothetical protein